MSSPLTDAASKAAMDDALAHHRAGRLDEADRRYANIIEEEPRNVQALTMLGTLHAQRANYQKAIATLGRSLAIDGRQPFALNSLGNALNAVGRHRDAVAAYEKAIALKPDHAAAYSNRGNALRALGLHEDALASCDKALSLDPNYVEGHCYRGDALRDLKRSEEALEAYGRAVDLRPNFAQVHFSRALLYQQMMNPQGAVESYDRVIAIVRDWADAHNNRGNALVELGRYEEAARSYETAVELKPSYAEAHNNRGNVLALLQRPKEALVSYQKAIHHKPGYADAHQNCGNTLRTMRDFEGAAESYRRVLSVRPDDAAAHLGHSVTLRELNRFDEALTSAKRAVESDPQLPYALGQLLLVKMHACDWDGLDDVQAAVFAAIEGNRRASVPFILIATECPLHILRRCAGLYAEDVVPPTVRSHGRQPTVASQSGRIRVAYVSADFNSHATAFLMAGVFEAHDRDRFDICAISLGRNDRSEMRMRLEQAFDVFIDAGDKTDQEIASLLRDLEVDIAVDLMGLTKGARPGIFALRPAPIQVNYLGYPGTVGVDYIDYLVADRVIIPEAEQRWYVESVVYLPDTYQCNDRKRSISPRISSRTELGLPEQGFVFCSFNASYKITPQVFDVWMRLLVKTEGSVLWLRESNKSSTRNLRREAEKRGVAGDRLVFAPVWSHGEHLARHRFADLFLDTLPCGAHTSASDALWAGLPVLTCLGESFAGRVAASLLQAVGLPDMVTHSLEEYETRALELAGNPVLLDEVTERLAHNRETRALFDTARFTRHLESAYEQMIERHRAGESPQPFAVDLIDDFSS
jgi:predicted O-linked N-acetylglucosamine transferase (SPINDLY family)